MALVVESEEFVEELALSVVDSVLLEELELSSVVVVEELVEDCLVVV